MRDSCVLQFAHGLRVHLDGNERQPIRLTPLAIELRTRLVARLPAVACSDFHGRHSRAVKRVRMHLICRHC